MALIAALQIGAELLIGRNYALALLCITPLALAMGQLVAPRPVGPLLLDRALETVLGFLVAVLVMLVVVDPSTRSEPSAQPDPPTRPDRPA